ncbi:MAG: dTMP kinase, partial [Candidatus Ranarchaeia archaeon]
AYQAAQRMPVSWILSINRFSLVPDLNILLDIEPQLALSRKPAVDKFENVSFLRKVREIYLHRAAENPAKWIVVDSGSSIDEVQSLIQEKIKPFFDFRS